MVVPWKANYFAYLKVSTHIEAVERLHAPFSFSHNSKWPIGKWQTRSRARTNRRPSTPTWGSRSSAQSRTATPQRREWEQFGRGTRNKRRAWSSHYRQRTTTKLLHIISLQCDTLYIDKWRFTARLFWRLKVANLGNALQSIFATAHLKMREQLERRRRSKTQGCVIFTQVKKNTSKI